MKITFWNVRGLGSFEKRKEVWKLVGEKKPYILCLQESKLQMLDGFVCSSLWGSSPHGYLFRSSVCASGGLLIMWKNDVVEVG